MQQTSRMRDLPSSSQPNSVLSLCLSVILPYVCPLFYSKLLNHRQSPIRYDCRFCQCIIIRLYIYDVYQCIAFSLYSPVCSYPSSLFPLFYRANPLVLPCFVHSECVLIAYEYDYTLCLVYLHNTQSTSYSPSLSVHSLSIMPTLGVHIQLLLVSLSVASAFGITCYVENDGVVVEQMNDKRRGCKVDGYRERERARQITTDGDQEFASGGEALAILLQRVPYRCWEEVHDEERTEIVCVCTSDRCNVNQLITDNKDQIMKVNKLKIESVEHQSGCISSHVC